MPGITVDGNDVLAVREAAAEAVALARAGQGPTFLENKTYRVKGHFEGDPQKYRPETEAQSWQDQHDPIKRFADALQKKKILSRKLIQSIWQEVESEIDGALAFAEQSPDPAPEDALEDLLVNP